MSTKHTLVKEWMTTNVVTVTPETSLPEADRLMVGNKIRRLPVVREGRLIGIVTRNNLWGRTVDDAAAVNLYQLDEQHAHITVSRVMTLNPVTIKADAELFEAVELMMTNKFSGLPVVDDAGMLAGIITESDLFRIMGREWLADANREVPLAGLGYDVD